MDKNRENTNLGIKMEDFDNNVLTWMIIGKMVIPNYGTKMVKLKSNKYLLMVD